MTPVPGDELREAMMHFATGVVVATTRTDGIDHATTLNSLTSVSLDPPLVLISLAVGSRFAAQVRETGVWGVSILADDAAALALRFAGPDRQQPMLAGLEHHEGVTGVMLLDECLAALECRTTDIHRAGDHDLVIGEVVATEVRAVAAEHRPLISHGRTFGRFTPAPSA